MATADEITTRALMSVIKEATDSGIAVVVIAQEMSGDSPLMDVASNIDQPVSIIGVLVSAIETISSPDYRVSVLSPDGVIKATSRQLKQ